MNYRVAPPGQVAALKYHGGPVIAASDTYAIYWDPVNAYHNDWMTLIDGYLHNVGAASGQLSNIFSLDGQYTGPGATRASYNSTFRGAYSDTAPYPSSGCTEPNGQPTCLTDAQIRTELKRFIEANNLPRGLNVIYFVLTPPAVTVCTDEGEKGNCSDSSSEKEEEVNRTTGSTLTANGFCGYHSAIEPTSESPIVYAVQPWVAGHAGHIVQQVPVKTLPPTAATLDCQNGSELVEPNQVSGVSRFDGYESGLADIIINDLSIEQDDILANPLVKSGWYQDTTLDEQSDLCKGGFSPAAAEELSKVPETTHALNITNESINGVPYYLQWALSSVGITSGKGIVCWQGTELLPHFTATNPVNGGDVVAFDANESGIALDANVTELKFDEPYLAPVYKWDFGDGSPVVDSGFAASVFHSYAHAGNYAVTLTIIDSGGNTESVTNTIPVGGPPPAGGGLHASGGASLVSPPGTTPGTTPQSQALPGPTVTDFVESTSLKKVLRSGLAVRYVVNEQVAGSLQVLLTRSTAMRLGIRGTTATGLPKGTPASIVIGTAVLVTTKAGKGTVRLRFTKTVAHLLAHTGQVKLMLRLVVRNGSRESPQTTTQLSTVTLKH